jgi:hypothetical protein
MYFLAYYLCDYCLRIFDFSGGEMDILDLLFENFDKDIFNIVS